MFKELPEKVGLVYKIGKKTYFIPKKVFKYQVKIIDFDRSHMKFPFKEVGDNKILKDLLNNMFSYSYNIFGDTHYASLEDLDKLPKNDLQRLHWGSGETSELHGIHKKLKLDFGETGKKFFQKFKKDKLKKNFYKNLLNDSFFNEFLVDDYNVPKEYVNEFYPYSEILVKKNPDMGLNPNLFCA